MSYTKFTDKERLIQLQQQVIHYKSEVGLFERRLHRALEQLKEGQEKLSYYKSMIRSNDHYLLAKEDYERTLSQLDAHISLLKTNVQKNRQKRIEFTKELEETIELHQYVIEHLLTKHEHKEKQLEESSMEFTKELEETIELHQYVIEHLLTEHEHKEKQLEESIQEKNALSKKLSTIENKAKNLKKENELLKQFKHDLETSKDFNNEIEQLRQRIEGADKKLLDDKLTDQQKNALNEEKQKIQKQLLSQLEKRSLLHSSVFESLAYKQEQEEIKKKYEKQQRELQQQIDDLLKEKDQLIQQYEEEKKSDSESHKEEQEEQTETVNDTKLDRITSYFTHSIITPKEEEKLILVVGNAIIQNFTDQSYLHPILCIRTSLKEEATFSGKIARRQMDDSLVLEEDDGEEKWEYAIENWKEKVVNYGEYWLKPIKLTELNAKEQLTFANFQIAVEQDKLTDPLIIEGFIYFQNAKEGIPFLNKIIIN
ncbi:hypothetical protein LC087_01750 [Bacillus carboniphilus]|uniref:Uncharacterized protein n=1 Tax=Bacillus carboniphilus TaxID=86663 RepID=A0ABY9JU88_9BACI|nr:hypothetical protein [Bacillus carboniphilus]WLR42969.1 hypothetical protein LC087_01750 [Bacillus carboniphilus]